MVHLAGEAAEVEGLLQDSVTREADVAGALERPGLRPRLQENHLGAVDRVGLDIGAVDELLEVTQADDVIVHVAPHLEERVVAVRGGAVRADGGAAGEAEDVALVLLAALV